MRILILYGTSEGQTRKIAGRLAERLKFLGHAVTLVDAAHRAPVLAAIDFDAVIIAARVHAGRYPRDILAFVRANRPALNGLPNAFLSVSMSAAMLVPRDQERLARYVSAFVRRTGWTPRHLYHVAGARLYTRHNAIGRWILGIVDHHRFDTAKDHEFTDWAQVDSLAGAFLAGIEPTAAAGTAAAGKALTR